MSHDPMDPFHWEDCELCQAARRMTFVEMADIPGKPLDWDELLNLMREIADRKVQLLRRNPDLNFVWNLG